MVAFCSAKERYKTLLSQERKATKINSQSIRKSALWGAAFVEQKATIQGIALIESQPSPRNLNHLRWWIQMLDEPGRAKAT